MTQKDIIDAYSILRTTDGTIEAIPYEVLDFMKDAAIEKLERWNNPAKQATEFGKQLRYSEFLSNGGTMTMEEWEADGRFDKSYLGE